MQKQVTEKGQLTFGYYTRDLRRIVTEVAGIKIEDLVAYMSFDAGLARLDVVNIPLPADAKMFEVAASFTQHLRQEYIRVAYDNEHIDVVLDQLIRKWDEMHGVVSVIRAIPIAGYYVFERSVEMNRETKEPGALAFIDSADYESPSLISERIKMGAMIISRFIPGVTVQVFTPKDGNYTTKAPNWLSVSPDTLLSTMAAQIGCTIQGEGLKDRIQSKAAGDLAMLHAWRQYVLNNVENGVLKLSDWQIRNAMAIISEFGELFNYPIRLSVSSGIYSLDVSILESNIKAARKWNEFYWQNRSQKWLPLAAHWNMQSTTGDWSVTVVPDYQRVEYNMSRMPLSLAGWDVSVMYPTKVSGRLSLSFPDYAADPVVKTYYRSTRMPTQLVGLAEHSIDPNLLLTTDTAKESFVAQFNAARIAISDMLSAKAFLRGSQPGPVQQITPETSESGSRYGWKKSNTKKVAVIDPRRSIINLATGALAPLLAHFPSWQDVNYVIPMNGSVMTNMGEFMARRPIQGYSLAIREDEDTLVSPVVAFRWDDETRRTIQYRYQTVTDDIATGLRAR